MDFGTPDLCAMVENELLPLHLVEAFLEFEVRRMCCTIGKFCSNIPLACNPDQPIFDNHYTIYGNSICVPSNVDRVGHCWFYK